MKKERICNHAAVFSVNALLRLSVYGVRPVFLTVLSARIANTAESLTRTAKSPINSALLPTIAG